MWPRTSSSSPSIPPVSLPVQMRMNEISCFCDGCLAYLPCIDRDRRRPADVEQRLYNIETQTGQFMEGYPARSQTGWEVVKKASIGDMVGLYVPELNRAGTNSNDGDLWSSRHYIIGEVAEVPQLRTNVGTRRRPSDDAMLKIYIPEEVLTHERGRRYRFPTMEVCQEDKKLGDGCTCGKRHHALVPVPMVRGGGPGSWMT